MFFFATPTMNRSVGWILPGLLWLSFGTSLLAKTSVGGSLAGNITWDATGSPYVVDRNLEVPQGSQLTIHPGVTVYLKGHSIVVRGKLISRGTAEQPILFTSANRESPAPMDWGMFSFEGAGSGASHDSQHRYQSGSILEHVIVEYGRGLFFHRSAPAVVNCTIRFNRKRFGGGIYAHDCKPIIRDSTISSNVAEESGGGVRAAYCEPVLIGNTMVRNSAAYDGGAISIDYSKAHIENNFIGYNFALRAGGICTGVTQEGQVSVTRQSTSRPKIFRNRIWNNRAIYAGGGISVRGTPEISENWIIGNRVQISTFQALPSSRSQIDRSSGVGAGIRVVETYGGPLSIQRNIVAGNRGAFWGAGLAFGSASGSVTNNRVVGNHARLHGGAISIQVQESHRTFMGDGHGADWNFSGNQMQGNSGGVFEFAQARHPGKQTIRVQQCDLLENEGDTFYNGTSVEMKAPSNYWGTVDPEEIGQRIHDYYDDDQLGRIHFQPAPQSVATSLPEVDPAKLAFIANCPQGIRAGQGFNRLPDTPPSVTLVWNQGDLVKPAGYLVHLTRVEPRFDEIDLKDGLRVVASCAEGASVVDVGNTTRTVLSGLTIGHTYEFFVTAYDADGQESSMSDTFAVKVER